MNYAAQQVALLKTLVNIQIATLKLLMTDSKLDENQRKHYAKLMEDALLTVAKVSDEAFEAGHD